MTIKIRNGAKGGGLLVGVLSMTITGCGSQTGGTAGAGGAPSSALSTETSALSGGGCLDSDYRHYSVGLQGDLVTSLDAGTYLCWPNQLYSDTGSNSLRPNANVTIDPGTNHWELYGDNAGMVCIPQRCFYSNASGAVRWLSDEFDASAFAPAGGGHQRVTTNLWQSDAMPIVMSLSHNGGNGYMNPNSYDRVLTDYDYYDPNPYAAATLQVEAHSTSTTAASTYSSARSFFVGTPSSGHLIKGEPGFTIDADGRTTTMNLTSTVSGICVLNWIAGMAASDSSVSLVRVSGVWQLSAVDTTIAGANCYDFDQDE